jgi:hypothetical protein
VNEKSGSTVLVKNPLTVIAIFAGLAEVSATIALPQLSEQVQALFVWFVMLFPALLVGLFFLLLWFKHQVLYAPSDFSNEENFMQHWLPDQRSKKMAVAEEVALELVAEQAVGNEAVPESPTTLSSNAPIDNPMSRYLEATISEDFAIKRLSREMNLSFARDVAYYQDRRITFDAVAEGPSGPIFVEAKKVFSPTRVTDVTRRALLKMKEAAEVIRPSSRGEARFILVIVVEFEISAEEISKLRSMPSLLGLGFPIEVRVMTLTSFAEE